MIERVIENWLTSANERSYELPYCQVLISRGHRILHINAHSPTEQGKDIISLAPNRQVCAYQLKGGDIALARWRREIKPEIVSLIENVVDYPGIRPTFAQPYLVCNGRVREPVIAEINNLNASNRLRRFKPLTVIQKPALLAEFLACQSVIFPKDPGDFGNFLALYSASGREMLDTAKLAQFLEDLVGLHIKQGQTPARSAASTVLMTAYVLSHAMNERNYFAVFEGWIVAIASLLQLGSRRQTAPKGTTDSINLALAEASWALGELTKEALSREHLFEEPSLVDGGPVYRARMTILAGSLSAWSLLQMLKGCRDQIPDAMPEFVETACKKMLVWGESAIPFVVMAALYLERSGRIRFAETLIFQACSMIASVNSNRKLVTFPDVYARAVDCVSTAAKVGEHPNADGRGFGHAYTVRLLIEMLARRLSRQHLSRIWYQITAIQHCEMEFASPEDVFQWHTTKGKLRQTFYPRPTKWSELRQDAGKSDWSTIHKALRRNELAILFPLVYPHRCNRALVRYIEHILAVC